jgi:hypothetical protein
VESGLFKVQKFKVGWWRAERVDSGQITVGRRFKVLKFKVGCAGRFNVQKFKVGLCRVWLVIEVQV